MDNKSDRHVKNHDEATKAFFSCVAGRTRSKRDEYSDKIAEARGVSSSSRRNVEATNASHDSGGISAPIAPIKQTTIVGKSRCNSSSCNNVGNTDSEEVSATHDRTRQKKRRRNQLKPTRRIGRRKNNLGKKGADMDIEDIEKIDESEFKRRKTCSASRIGHSARQESKGFSAATSWKNVDIVSKKHSASQDFSLEDVSHGSDRGLLTQKGNGDEGMEFEGIDIERIEEVEFMNLKTYLTSKIGSSIKEELNEGYSAVTPRKDVSNLSKKSSSADYCESVYPQDASHGSDHAWPWESSPLVQRGSVSENMVPEEIEIEKIDEAEFRNQKTHFGSKIVCSMEQGLCAASSSKNVHGASKTISSADHSVSFSPRNYGTGSDLLVDYSRPSAKKGSDSENMVPEEIKIEKIDEAEFRNQKTHLGSKIGCSMEQGLCDASSSKNVHGASKTISSADHSVSFSPRNYCTGSDLLVDDSRPSAKKGSDSENMVPGEIEIEKIDEAEFRNQKTHFGSKIGCSMEQGLCAASSSKNVHGASKTISSTDHSVSFSPRNYGTGSDLLVDDSRPSAKKGSDRENMVPVEIEIEKIDEAEFRNQKTHFGSKIGCSMEQGLCAASSSRNVHGASKTISSADHSVSFSPRNCCTGSDLVVDDSRPLAKKGTNNEPTSCREIKIKRIDEAEFKNGKSRITSKIRSSTRQGYSAANSWQNADILKEVSFGNNCGSFSSADAGGDFDKGKTVNSSSSAEKGNKYEDMDPEELGIEKIDEFEFRNKRTPFDSKIGSSTWQEPDGHFDATCGKNVKSASKKMSSIGKIDKNKNKREVSSYSRSKEKGEAWKKNLHYDVNNSSDECTSSYSSSESNSNNINTFLQDDEISSYGEKHEMNLSIAGRTRSKMGSIKKPAEVGNSSLDLSLDSDFSSSSEGESSDNFDGTELCSHVEACEVQNNILMKASAKKSEDCSKQEGSAVKHAPNRRHLNLQNKESNCEQLTFKKREFSSMKKQLSNDASSKQTGGKAHKTCEVHDENEEINITVGDDAKAEEGLKERSNFPKSTCSEQLYAQNDCDEAKGVDGLHPKDQSQARIKRQKKEASPTHSKDDYNYSDDDDDDKDDDDGDNDDIHEKIEATSSEIHGDDKVGTVHVTDEIKEPTGGKQVSSKHYDLCSMLADAILGSGPVLETKGSDEEAMQAPPSQTQNTIPLKFRFEDEVPREVEKTEHEKEIEDLFAELDLNWALEELGSFNYPEVDQENGNSPDEETRHARCAKGKHELVLQDDQGLICIFCRHVELGPRDILPPWVEKTYQDSGRKRHREAEQEQPLELDDGLHLESSINNVADFGNSANGTVWSIKPGIRDSMYEHQREGFEFLWKNLAGSINLDELKSADPGGVGGCIISHAPGTGKSRLTIVFIETYLKMFPHCRPVIIGPASMLLTWEEEFRKWNVEFPFLNLNNPELLGKENKSALGLLARAKGRNMDVVRMVKICSWSMGSSILGISYSLFEKLTGENIKGKTSKKRKTPDSQMQKMRKILLEKPGLVVLDEGHTPRNQRSNIWNALLKLQTEKRVILSGTPFQNNFAELFNTLRLVRPAIAGVLAQEKMFAEMIASRRMSSSRKSKGEHSQSPLISEVIDRAVDKLKISMVPFVHVHKGTILLQNLPGLRDCVVLLKPSALQKSLIERLEGSPNTFEFEHKVALIAVHPYLFQHFDSTEEQRIGIDMGALEASKVNPNEGVKTKFILELVRLSVVMKEKVLIFSQYIQPLELIKEQLRESFKWVDGKEILQMQGKLEQKQRQILINVFNDPKSEAKIMLASTRCCSEGISLIGASRVVLLDVVWNPSVERQAICRAYRIGQEKFVYTYHLMTSGTTEADKYCRQAEKERLSELVFTSSSNESNKQKHPSLGIEDRILEEMVGHEKLKEMFEKIINQPKDTDLIQTFGLTS